MQLASPLTHVSPVHAAENKSRGTGERAVVSGHAYHRTSRDHTLPGATDL